MASEIFGFDPDSLISGWTELSADQGSLATLYQVGGKRSLDGGLALNRTLTKFYFNRINESSCSGEKKPDIYLALANPNREAVTLRLRLFQNEPMGIETNRTLPPRGSLYATLEKIFGVVEPKQGFIEGFVVEGEGVVGLQVIDYKDQDSLILLPARDDTSSKQGYSAQLASGNGWFTSISLVNAHPESLERHYEVSNSEIGSFSQD